MNLTNLYDQLEYYQHKQEVVDHDLDHVLALMESIKTRRNELLEQRSELYWKIKEIKDQIEDQEVK